MSRGKLIAAGWCLVILGVVASGAAAADETAPIRVHPTNPRYFEWRGKAVALVTSGEHYGAVINSDFDYKRYLETLARDGLNLTRLFTGSYVEPQGAFGIEHNNLAPAKGRYLAPWARSETPGYAGGGNKLDLDHFSDEYLARLKDFLTEADRLGIVVELVLFSSTYTDASWAIHPFNPANNIQELKVPDWKPLNTLESGEALAYQEKLVRWLARELNGFDNLYFEIQNEPWSDHHEMGEMINPYWVEKPAWPNAVEIPTESSVAWQTRVAQWLADEESGLEQRHLIAQNLANFRLAARPEDLAPGVGLVNFHYAYPEAATWNLGLRQVLGCNETGFAGREDATYRRQAWNFLFSGGALYNNLDYSFTVEKPDGTEAENQAPGGGSQALRKQLGVLSSLLNGLDLARMSPDTILVRSCTGAVARALSTQAAGTGAFSAAIYVEGRGPSVLELNLPAGEHVIRWVMPADGTELRQERLMVEKAGQYTVLSPFYKEAVALTIRPVE